MDDKPKRRWFRFRLSTVLVLTATLAWGMATRPWWNKWQLSLVELRQIELGPSATPAENVQLWKLKQFGWAVRWPALALAAFLAWKAGCAVVERRRRQIGAPE